MSPLAWAIYTALVGIIVHGAMRWHVAQGGLGPQDFSDSEALSNMVKAAMPEYAKYIDEQGISGLHVLVDTLEMKLLAEFQAMMTGADTDRSSVQQAKDIMKYSEELRKETISAEAAQLSVGANVR